MSKILLWLYRIMSYFVPCGITLYTFVIENILNKEVTIMTKIGASGLFVIGILVVIGIFFVGSTFTRAEKELEKKSIKEIDLNKRAEYIKKWEQVENRHKIFNQIITLSVLVGITALIYMIEKSLINLRGTMIFICMSYGSGIGCLTISKNMEFSKKYNNESGNNKE